MRTAPCKGCQDRFVGCHSQCTGYRAYNDQCEKVREARQKNVTANDYLRESFVRYEKFKRMHTQNV